MHYPKDKPHVWRSAVYGTATLQSPSVGEPPQTALTQSRSDQKIPLLDRKPFQNHVVFDLIIKKTDYLPNSLKQNLIKLCVSENFSNSQKVTAYTSLPLSPLPLHFIPSIWHSHIEFLSCETSGMLLAIAPQAAMNQRWTSTQSSEKVSLFCVKPHVTLSFLYQTGVCSRAVDVKACICLCMCFSVAMSKRCCSLPYLHETFYGEHRLWALHLSGSRESNSVDGCVAAVRLSSLGTVTFAECVNDIRANCAGC